MRFCRLQASRGSKTRTSWPRETSSVATPRRKCALPWFQSDSSEWTKKTIRIRGGRGLDRHLPGERVLVLVGAALGEDLAVGFEVALDHPLRRQLQRPGAGPGGERGPAVRVLDQPQEGPLQGLRVVRGHEDGAVLPRLAKARDVA